MHRPRVSMSMDGTGMVDEAMNVDYERFMDPYPWKHASRRLMRELTGVAGARPENLLEMGCGPAHLLAAFAATAPDVHLHGVDLSEHMLRIAAARLDRAGLADRVALHRGSVYDMPFEGESFDAVVSHNALHCFDDLSALFAEALRVTRPGGAIVMHAWRRDMAWPLGVGARAHSALLRATGSHLEGAGPVLDASYTGREVLDALSTVPGAEVWTKEGLSELVVMVAKDRAAA